MDIAYTETIIEAHFDQICCDVTCTEKQSLKTDQFIPVDKIIAFLYFLNNG